MTTTHALLCLLLVSTVCALGCSVQRQPLTTVTPSYSYVADQPQLSSADIWPVRTSLRASGDSDAPVAMVEGYQEVLLHRRAAGSQPRADTGE